MTGKGKTKADVFYNNHTGLYDFNILIEGNIVEGKKGYFSKANCIAFCNQRIQFWNKKRNINIPLVEEQQ